MQKVGDMDTNENVYCAECFNIVTIMVDGQSDCCDDDVITAEQRAKRWIIETGMPVTLLVGEDDWGTIRSVGVDRVHVAIADGSHVCEYTLDEIAPYAW